jgi:hypothetical protein
MTVRAIYLAEIQGITYIITISRKLPQANAFDKNFPELYGNFKKILIPRFVCLIQNVIATNPVWMDGLTQDGETQLIGSRYDKKK